MSQFKTIVIAFAVCLVALCARSAPTDSEASTTPMAPTEKSPSSTTPVPKSDTETSSMAVSAAQDTPHLSNTTFTCYSRKVGYYADIDSSCKVYHFCMLGDYNGQEVYQRISYLCLGETVFDQQVLDCVEPSKISAPCSDAAKYYDESNTVLRKAILGKPTAENEKDETTSAHDSASASSSTTSAPSTISTTTTSAPSTR